LQSQFVCCSLDLVDAIIIGDINIIDRAAIIINERIVKLYKNSKF